MADKTASGPVWSFVTTSSATPTPTPTPGSLQLILETGGPSVTQAAAFDTVLHVRSVSDYQQ